MLKHNNSRTDSTKRFGQAGFTLIELLVVVVILGILAAVVVFSVRGFSSDAQSNACATELRTIRSATETFYAQNTAYPADVDALETAGLLTDDTVEGTYTINGTTGAVAQTTCP